MPDAGRRRSYRPRQTRCCPPDEPSRLSALHSYCVPRLAQSTFVAQLRMQTPLLYARVQSPPGKLPPVRHRPLARPVWRTARAPWLARASAI